MDSKFQYEQKLEQELLSTEIWNFIENGKSVNVLNRLFFVDVTKSPCRENYSEYAYCKFLFRLVKAFTEKQKIIQTTATELLGKHFPLDLVCMIEYFITSKKKRRKDIKNIFQHRIDSWVFVRITYQELKDFIDAGLGINWSFSYRGKSTILYHFTLLEHSLCEPLGMTEMLLRLGANPNISSDNTTNNLTRCLEGHLRLFEIRFPNEIIDLLIEYGFGTPTINKRTKKIERIPHIMSLHCDLSLLKKHNIHKFTLAGCKYSTDFENTLTI